jgi:predicted phage terminase large subunit-like protein
MVGFRGSFVCLDDPMSVKDRFDREKKTKNWDVFKKDLSTRVTDPASATWLIIAQRLADDDIIGRLKADDAEWPLWVHLDLPAKFIPSERCVSVFFVDPRKERDEPLFPALYPAEAIARLERDLGPDDASAQLQQRPVKDSGARFNREKIRRWEWVKPLEPGHAVGLPVVRLLKPGGEHELVRLDLCWTFVSVDVAVSEEDRACFTVALTWAVSPDKKQMILLARYKARADEPANVRALEAIHDRTNHAGMRNTLYAVEKNGVGKPLIQQLLVRGLPVVAIPMHQDKFVRSAQAVIYTDIGQVYLPQVTEGEWVTDLLNQLINYPLAEHDDDVDAYSLGVNGLFEGLVGALVGGESPEGATRPQAEPGDTDGVAAPRGRAPGRSRIGM